MGAFSCPKCGSTMKYIRKLRYHLKYECGTYICEICGKCFKRKCSLVNHLCPVIKG